MAYLAVRTCDVAGADDARADAFAAALSRCLETGVQDHREVWFLTVVRRRRMTDETGQDCLWLIGE